MTKRGGHRQRAESKAEEQTEESVAFQWIPPWGWAILFLAPLLLSEFMFWNVGKIPSMIIFPIAWIGFWYTVMERSGWPILKGRKDKAKPAAEEDG